MLKYKLLIHLAFAITILSLPACKKTELPSQHSPAAFFNKSVIVSGNRLVESGTAFSDPVSKEINESLVDGAILELEKLDLKDRFVGRISRTVGQPVWNESLVFTGGDKAQTIITPLYNNAAQVNGVLFSTFRKDGTFRTQILSKQFAQRALKDTCSSIKSVSRSTFNGIINYLQTRKSPADAIAQTNLNTVADMGFIYTVCWYVPMLVYAPSTVVFVKQCHSEVYFGDYQEWDYYYSQNYNYIEEQEGYYESYDQEEINRATENMWEIHHTDTTGLANYPCLMNIIHRLMDNPTTDFGKMVAKYFESSFQFYGGPASYDFNVNFEVVPTLGPNNSLSARTTSQLNGNSLIRINKSVFENCTDLYAASVIIHEFTHAYLAGIMFGAERDDTTVLNDFLGCFNGYADYVWDQTNWNLFDNNLGHHEYMAGFMVHTMATALSEFDGQQQDFEYYWMLAWGSLQDTPTWQYYSAHPMPSEAYAGYNSWDYALTADRMAAITSIISKEQYNTAGAKGKLHNFNNCY